MILRQMACIFLILATFFSVLRPAPGLAAAPQAVVGDFQDALVAVMKKAETLDMKERARALSGPVKKTFLLSEIARIAVGSHWKSAADSQRRELVRAFTRMSVSTLATHFDGWSGERFEITGEHPGPQATRIVLTRLILSDGDKVAIDYIMVKGDDTWKVIDVILDKGISELSVRRSEYSLMLRQQGIGGLVRLLDDKADELMGP